MKADEKAAASRDVGGQSVEEVDWRGILRTLNLTQQQADALAKVSPFKASLQQSLDRQFGRCGAWL